MKKILIVEDDQAVQNLVVCVVVNVLRKIAVKNL